MNNPMNISIPDHYQQSPLLQQFTQKFPLWNHNELLIFLQCYQQNNVTEPELIQTKLIEMGSKKTLEEVIEIIQGYKNQDWQVKQNNPITVQQNHRSNELGHRKTASIANKFINDYVTTLNLKSDKKKKVSGEQEVNKKKKIQQHKYLSNQHFKSKRKIKPQENIPINDSFNADQRLLNLEFQNKDCQNYLTKKNNKKISSNCNFNLIINNNTNIEHQFFYANYDKPYFTHNPYQQMIDDANIPRTLSYGMHRKLRQLMGRPRSFGLLLLRNEKNNLEEYRNLVRNYVKGQNSKQNLEIPINLIPYFKNLNPLTVGQSVIALHPLCGHLHVGSILALYKENLIMVKFQNPELGVQKILDINISSQYLMKKTDLANQRNLPNRVDNEPQNNKSNQILQNIDFYSMACYLKLLQYKNELIIQMRQNNNQLQRMIQNKQQISEEFRQKYGWIASIINIINFSLKHVITKFRLRGVSNYNKDDLGKNLSKLLVNPLNIMEKQLESHPEAPDIHAVKQIRQIISLHQQIRTEETVQKICSKVKEEGNIYIADSRLEDLVKNFLSILVTLKSEGKIANISENKYMKKIATELYPNESDKLSQIGDLLYTISER